MSYQVTEIRLVGPRFRVRGSLLFCRLRCGLHRHAYLASSREHDAWTFSSQELSPVGVLAAAGTGLAGKHEWDGRRPERPWRRVRLVGSLQPGIEAEVQGQ